MSINDQINIIKFSRTKIVEITTSDTLFDAKLCSSRAKLVDRWILFLWTSPAVITNYAQNEGRPVWILMFCQCISCERRNKNQIGKKCIKQACLENTAWRCVAWKETMVILNITMAKQGLRENSESESGLPCDKMFGRLYSSFHCMGCAVLRASILYSDARFVWQNEWRIYNFNSRIKGNKFIGHDFSYRVAPKRAVCIVSGRSV